MSRLYEETNSDLLFLELDCAPLDIEDALALEDLDEDHGPSWWMGLAMLALPAITIVAVMAFGLVCFVVELVRTS